MEVEKINHVIIEHTPAGKYFAVLNVDFESEPRSNAGGTIGIDVGIKAFYSDSNWKYGIKSQISGTLNAKTHKRTAQAFPKTKRFP